MKKKIDCPRSRRSAHTYAFLLLVAGLTAFRPANGQQNSGVLNLYARDGSTIDVPINAGITISRISCDSMRLNENWYYNISKIIRRPCDTTATSVESPEVNIPERLTLTVYPNPATGHTRILVYSPGDEVAVVGVYSVLGLLIRHFETFGSANPQQAINWDLSDNAGMPVAPGVYFIRAATRRGVVTRAIQILQP